jgi:hypothetical protein
MRGVLHIDEVAQFTVEIDECALRIGRSCVPEDIDVTEAVLRPDIELRSVSRRYLHGLPFAHLKHSLTSSLIRYLSGSLLQCPLGSIA